MLSFWVIMLLISYISAAEVVDVRCPQVCSCREHKAQLSTIILIDCSSTGLITAAMMQNQQDEIALTANRGNKESLAKVNVWLDASGNKLSENRLTQGLIQPVYSELTSISLCCSSLSAVDENAFTDLVGVKILDLSFNAIIYLDFLSLLPELVELNLESNQVRIIPSHIIRAVKNIRKLNLSSNKLISMAFLSDNLYYLEYIDLSINDLRIVSKGVFDKKSYLQYINISQNHIQSLPYCSMKSLLQTVIPKTLDISSNPFICDCELVWMNKWSGDILHAECAGEAANYSDTLEVSNDCTDEDLPTCQVNQHEIGWNPYATLPPTPEKITIDAGAAVDKSTPHTDPEKSTAARSAQVFLIVGGCTLIACVALAAVVKNRRMVNQKEKEEESAEDGKYDETFRLSIIEQPEQVVEDEQQVGRGRRMSLSEPDIDMVVNWTNEMPQPVRNRDLFDKWNDTESI